MRYTASCPAPPRCGDSGFGDFVDRLVEYCRTCPIAHVAAEADFFLS
ncbi:hypothetical protein [Streptomyces sp. NPDC006334]